jgi:uncharacterized membrane protein YccC
MKTLMMRKFCYGEPDAHVMMRRARALIVTLILLSLSSTVILYFVARPAIYLAVIALSLLSVALLFVGYLEQRSRGLRLRTYNQLSISKEEVEMDVQYAGIYTALGLILLFSVGSFMVAATMVQAWSTVGVTAVVLFLMSSLILIPYIALFVRGAAQDQRDKLAREAIKRIESVHNIREQVLLKAPFKQRIL